MSIWEIIVIAIGLSMDAFAVSICKGLSIQKLKSSNMLITGLYFGGFQALMPLIGYLLGKQFERFITRVDHWIAFALLAVIGINMIREAVKNENECADCSFDVKSMLPLAIATSIDALAVGITFAFLDVNIYVSVILIGIITFAFSAVGIKIGNAFGTKFKSKAEFSGGIILILMGVKILFSHLGII